MKSQLISKEDYISKLNKYKDLVPSIVILDVEKRITDWLSSGGSLNDEYVKRQFLYIENYIETVK